MPTVLEITIEVPYEIIETPDVFRIMKKDNREVIVRADKRYTTVIIKQPLTYETWHTLKEMNIRPQPNTYESAVGSVAANINLELSTVPVDTAMLDTLNLSYPIETGYTWRYIGTGIFAGKFIATASGNVDNVVKGAYVPPTIPPPTNGAPSKLTGKNLSLVTTSGGTYLKNGTGMGANLREVAYWGSDAARWMSPGDRARYFAFLRDNGFKWVRFTAFHRNHSVEDAIARVSIIADQLRSYGLLGCVTFMDSLGDSGFTFPNYDVYHNQPHGHLNRNFYLNEAWRSPLLPAIEKLVTALRGHTGIGMWQIMNEPAIYPQPATQSDTNAFEKMISTIAARVHEIDTGTPISGGFISTHHFAPSGVDMNTFSAAFWKRQPNLHVATVHAYQDTGNVNGLFTDEIYMQIDATEAMKTGRAYGITEFGSNVNRVESERVFLQRHLKSSFNMRWALDLEPVDKGIGDTTWGWMKWGFNDFESLLNLFKSIRWNV